MITITLPALWVNRVNPEYEYSLLILETIYIIIKITKETKLGGRLRHVYSFMGLAQKSINPPTANRRVYFFISITIAYVIIKIINVCIISILKHLPPYQINSDKDSFYTFLSTLSVVMKATA